MGVIRGVQTYKKSLGLNKRPQKDRLEARRKFLLTVTVLRAPIGSTLLNGGCWEWTGGVNEKDYGRFSFKGRTVLAHRAAYEIWRGPIPKDKIMRHLCEHTWCVNPYHEIPGTHTENTQDMLKGVAKNVPVSLFAIPTVAE